jgi:nucleotide-binding universal stress UspA family protein
VSSPATVDQGIVAAARKGRCDAIFMASHGRGELTSLVLGSVTLKVLAHSKIPVMVFR